VFFDDVRVAVDRAAVLASHHPERELNAIFSAENDMERWANPALEWNRDEKTGWAVHRYRFPGEQVVVINTPKFSELTVSLGCGKDGAYLRRAPLLTIKDGVASFSGEGYDTNTVKLPRGAIKRIAFRNGLVDIDGVKLKAQPRTEALAPPQSISDANYVAIKGLKNLGDPQTVRVSSSNLLEYTFNSAPTDWKVESGRWGLLNKWICDPRWSWFGGRTKTLAALWNKNVFSGDVTVDAHVALMMQKEDPPFERPGDYNIALSGDGVHLDSGYTLVFAGDQAGIASALVSPEAREKGPGGFILSRQCARIHVRRSRAAAGRTRGILDGGQRISAFARAHRI